MLNQHAKWLKVCNGIRWRRPIASVSFRSDELYQRARCNGAAARGSYEEWVEKEGAEDAMTLH